MMLPEERKDKDRVNGFSSSERSYQLDEPGISHGKYEDNMYLSEPSSHIC